MQRRYFVDNTDGRPGWAIILRSVVLSAPISSVMTAWFADNDEWDRFDEEERREEEQEKEKQRRSLLELLSPPKGPIHPPLAYYEALVIAWLAEQRAGTAFKARIVPNLGPALRKSLLHRYFIEIRS